MRRIITFTHPINHLLRRGHVLARDDMMNVIYYLVLNMLRRASYLLDKRIAIDLGSAIGR